MRSGRYESNSTYDYETGHNQNHSSYFQTEMNSEDVNELGMGLLKQFVVPSIFFFVKMDVFFNPFRSNKILSEGRWTSLISTKSLADTIFVSVRKDWSELKIPFDI